MTYYCGLHQIFDQICEFEIQLKALFSFIMIYQINRPCFPTGSHFNIPSENPYIVTSLQFTRFFMQTNVRKTRALSIIVNQARNKALKKAGPADSIDNSVKSFMSNGSAWRM